jgi:hypothetical protein
MFERITTDPDFQKYTPQILSQPPKGPWVVVLDNVISAEECQRLIDLGGEVGYEVSMDTGKKQKFDGTFEGYTNQKRTSTNAVRVAIRVKDAFHCLSSNLLSIHLIVSFRFIFLYG